MHILLNSLWLGLLTSITPCVLSANLAIVSYSSKQKKNNGEVLFSSIFYLLGRIIFYTALSFALSFSIDKIEPVSQFLQNKLNIVLGIILVFVGMALLNIINLDFLHLSLGGKIRKKTDKSKYLGSFIFGVLLSGMFCPVTASLFIANLIQSNSNMYSFILYGFGTGFTAFVLANLLVFSANNFKKFHKHLGYFEKYSSKITGIVFVTIGILLIFKLF